MSEPLQKPLSDFMFQLSAPRMGHPLESLSLSMRIKQGRKTGPSWVFLRSTLGQLHCYIIELRAQRLETSPTKVMSLRGHDVRKHLNAVAKSVSSDIRSPGFRSKLHCFLHVTLGKFIKLFVTQMCPLPYRDMVGLCGTQGYKNLKCDKISILFFLATLTFDKAFYLQYILSSSHWAHMVNNNDYPNFYRFENWQQEKLVSSTWAVARWGTKARWSGLEGISVLHPSPYLKAQLGMSSMSPVKHTWGETRLTPNDGNKPWNRWGGPQIAEGQDHFAIQCGTTLQ